MSQHRITGSPITITSDSLVINAPIANRGLYFASESETGPTPRSMALGTLAGASLTTGTDNTFLGFNCGQYTTIGSNNTFVGSQAGNNNANGISNTFQGSFCGHLATGSWNTATGHNAAYRVTGNDNCIYGNNAAPVLTSGTRNIIIGKSSCGALSTGANNCITGTLSASALTTGGGNCIYGDGLGASLTTGSSNILMGTAAGNGVATGSSNIILGHTFSTNQAGQTLTSGSNNIILAGDVAATNTSNAIVIGKGGSHTTCTIAAISGVNQTGPNVAVTVNGSGQLGIGAVSLREKKDDIEAIDEALNHEKLMQVKPRNYTFKDWTEKIQQHGVIIDEIKPIYPELVGQCNGEDFYVNYEQFIALLIADLQYAWKSMHNLESRLVALENKNI